MKKTSIIFILLVFLGTSCKKYLDVNTNPNQPTSSTPELVLPQAMVYTAAVVNTYNTYGAQLGGYMANAYGYGGFGDNFSYGFTSGDYATLWSGSYDVLNDLQFVLNATDSIRDTYAYYRAAAIILQVYNFELLVDTYNNIPFSDALKGLGSLSPKYDDAKAIYPALANMLDTAIATINNASADAQPLGVGRDPLFNQTAITVLASNTLWKQFANTLKLRLIIKARSGGVAMPNNTFDAAGFLTTDAIVNPGYARATAPSGTQVNPEFNTWVVTYSGAAGNRAWVPSIWIFGFYDGTKITDNDRGNACFNNFPLTGKTQLGNINSGGNVSGVSNWYCTPYYGAPTAATSAGNNIGIMKGPDMGQPLITAAESYLLQAEAVVRGIPGVSGSAQTLFNTGVTQSFAYLFKLPNGNIGIIGGDPLSATASFAGYQAANPGNYLVNFAAATSTEQQIEAIITQKYIALNMINSNEGWNEYRRTGYPTVVSNGGAYGTFASTQSAATAPDKLPTRIQYPQAEFSYNPDNVPGGGTSKSPAAVSVFTDKIFWAK